MTEGGGHYIHAEKLRHTNTESAVVRDLSHPEPADRDAAVRANLISNLE